MPRLTHEANETQWPYELQMMLTLVLQHLNVLREAVELPPVTLQDLRHAMAEYQRTHPRQGRTA